MTDEPPLLRSLRTAVAAAPDDSTLRVHLAEQLLGVGRAQDAVAECAQALARDPGCEPARTLMSRALAPPQPAAGQPAEGFDWASAEHDLGDAVPPMFVTTEGEDLSVDTAFDLERPALCLSDVGGMEQVKERLELAFLGPMRHPELRQAYGKSLRGGLLLYGPPGCGKTFLARAVAGELGARFLTVGLADVLDMYTGQSERNLHDVFELVRRSAPCVLFLDEIDALGQKRSQLRNSAMRGTVNQLLSELDDVAQGNEGVFVLAATNHPWDVDEAMRRPGRLDRTLLVLPPDAPAREAIFRYHLQRRPIATIDLRRLAGATDGFSGADIAHVCESATEAVMAQAMRSGQVQMIDMAALQAALSQVRPSTTAWFASARNVALFANDGGAYDELLGYLKKRRMA